MLVLFLYLSVYFRECSLYYRDYHREIISSCLDCWMVTVRYGDGEIEYLEVTCIAGNIQLMLGLLDGDGEER